MAKKINNYQSSSVYPWIIWTIAASFFFYKYLIQVSPSVMTFDLMKTFNVNGAGLGNLSAFYFYAYVIMQIPVGILLDKYSPRLLTTGAIFLCSISIFIFAQATNLTLACIARAFIGGGAAFAAISCFKLASLWFPAKRFAFVSGMFMTAAMLGAVGGQMPLSFLVQRTDWRIALEIVSFAGIILGMLYFIIVKDKPNYHPIVLQKNKRPMPYSFKQILCNKQTWYLSLYSGLAFAPVSVFGGLWGVPFLETAYQLSRNDAALAISFIFIGFAVGAPFLGWLSDFIGRRKPILFFGTMLAFICLSIVIYSTQLGSLALIFLLFCFGFGASGFFTCFAMIREVFPVILAGTVLGLMNAFDSVCEAVYEPVVGAFLDWTWQGNVRNGIHQFSITGYHLSLSLLPVSLILALVMIYFIKETYCKSKEEIGFNMPQSISYSSATLASEAI